MNINHNNDNNTGWKTVGNNRKKRNKQKRIIKKKQEKELKTKQQKQFEKIKKIQQERLRKDNEWRKKRIELIKAKEFESFKSRKITPKFAQSIQSERAKKNISRKNLALKLMIPESELASYENAQKCPPSQTIVKLRKLFSNLPTKYYSNDN